MGAASNLYYYEQIMLLSLRDKEGTVFPNINFRFAIAGAIIADLLQEGRTRIEQEKRKKFLVIKKSAPLNDPILNECLTKLQTAKRRQQLQTWVSRFANLKNLKHRAAAQLCQRGILKADEDTVMLLFKRKIYPEINPLPEKKIISDLRQAVLTENDAVEVPTVILLSLAKSTNLLKTIFNRQELKTHKNRIEKLIKAELIGQATQEAIEALQAAVMVAVIVPSITATTSTN